MNKGDYNTNRNQRQVKGKRSNQGGWYKKTAADKQGY
jgi:hypothetical protein